MHTSSMGVVVVPLNELILNLVAGIDDPGVRLDIANTIRYLYSVYMSKPELEPDIRDSLYEVAYTVVTMKFPFESEDERKKRAKKIADEIFQAFKMESMYIRSIKRFRLALEV